MVYTVQCASGATGAAIRSALARTSADEVALVFPLGEACALADAAELAALHEHCQALGKRVVAIGGDQEFRALAVAAGFAAATSLEEWETSKHKAVRRRRITLGPKRRQRAELEGPPTPGQVSVVRAQATIAEEGDGDLYDPVGDDPPRYVAKLVAADEALSSTDRLAAIPTIPLQRGRITRRLEELRREAAEAAAVDRAQQAYEEQITETIRTSGEAGTSGDSEKAKDRPAAGGTEVGT
jgi:hypothetical protein